MEVIRLKQIYLRISEKLLMKRAMTTVNIYPKKVSFPAIFGTFGLVSSEAGVFMACIFHLTEVHTSLFMHTRNKKHLIWFDDNGHFDTRVHWLTLKRELLNACCFQQNEVNVTPILNSENHKALIYTFRDISKKSHISSHFWHFWACIIRSGWFFGMQISP